MSLNVLVLKVVKEEKKVLFVGRIQSEPAANLRTARCYVQRTFQTLPHSQLPPRFLPWYLHFPRPFPRPLRAVPYSPAFHSHGRDQSTGVARVSWEDNAHGNSTAKRGQGDALSLTGLPSARNMWHVWVFLMF